MSVRPGNAETIRVLVVEDEPEVVAVYRAALGADDPPLGAEFDDPRRRLFADRPAATPEHTPFQVDAAASAEPAVALVRAALQARRPYDVVFLDLRTPPGPDGLWTAERIRALDPQLDIVVCTAYAELDSDEFGRRVPPSHRLFYLEKPLRLHEVRQIACALGHKRVAEAQVTRLAYFDSLTGLPNRERIRRAMQQAIEQAHRLGGQFALLYLDLDHFKRINDALGHRSGDELLREVARRLRRIVRQGDIVIAPGNPAHGGNQVARLGGDEFAVLLPGVERNEDALAVAQRVHGELRQPVPLAMCEVLVTPSIGVSFYPRHGVDTDTLFRNADLAMYYAKRHGRGSSVIFTDSMNSDSLRRLTLEALLRKALAGDELSLRYQPQVDLRGGAFCGMEALLRWNCPEAGAVSPAEFVPVAEESGLILPIGEWVLREACRQGEEWRREGLGLQSIAVNVSALQFTQPGFPGLVERVLAETGLPAGCLELELTESMLMSDEDNARDTLRRLKDVGVMLAIDDFGTGYSNLSRLRQFRVDRLKIDRSFVDGINNCADDAAIAAAIINMGKTLGLDVVAEGVEDFDQIQFLQRRDCERVQGFLLSEPLTPQEARAFLARVSDATIIRRIRSSDLLSRSG
jgi:diguanylate cyclase (GGDEF)-like protein